MILAVSLIIYLLGKAHGSSDIVPAFIIDTENVLSSITVDSNPFQRTSRETFTNILQQISQKSGVVIIFVENSFCTEDISGRDSRDTPFYHLRQQLLDKKAKYFPAVATPYSLLKKQFPPQQYNVFHLKSTSTKLQIFDGRFKYFYAYFDDGGNETRVDALRRHDLIMKEVYFVLKQMSSGPVVAIYTGKLNPIDADLRETKHFSASLPNPNIKDNLLFSTNTTLYKLSGVQLLSSGRRWMQEQPVSVEEEYNQNFIRTKMEFANFMLEFNYKLSKKDWTLDSIKVFEENEEVGILRTCISAPWGYSYSCHEKLAIVNHRDGSVITIPHYQIEPIKEWLTIENVGRSGEIRRYFQRSETVNCGPYFSAGIIMALFVVGIILAILFYGIVGVMDIRSNSRYDDPNGKPLIYSDLGSNQL